MAGGIHASSPGSATVTHQMGHSVLPPEYALHHQTVLENGVPLNEATNSIDVNVVESSTSRKRKHSADATNHQLESKRTCIYNQLLTDMIIEKEKYLYFWLLNEYSRSDEKDFLGFVNKIKFSDSFLPSPNPQYPKSVYFSSEPESFQNLFPSDVVSELKTIKAIKQESSESTTLSTDHYEAKSTHSLALVRPPFRQPSISGDNNSQQIVEKAKQEAQVYQRINELQKLGLWTEKRLPKVQEPPRVKAHWDYVLEELEWLAADFAQERKWKKAAARKRSRMIQKHFQEREALVQKTARAAELHKRKIASHLAKIVKSFWNNVEKLVDFKQQTKLKEKRQQALDQHLSFIVDKTEKYSSLVAESMSKSAVMAQENSRSHSPISDVEFEPNQTSSDDEETIEAEEKGSSADAIDHTKEIEMLKRESQLPLEDLLNQLPEEYLNDVDKLKPIDKVPQLVDDDDEYETEADVSDDETTLLEEEKIQGAVDYKTEIAELEADNDLSIEELMKKYNTPGVDALENSTPSSSTESTSESEPEESDDSSSDDDDETEEDEKLNDDEESDGLMSLLKDSTLENGDINDENADEKIDNVAAIAESIQPKGNTLSSTCVVTKVPFLLKHSLREYQHIGLDWLVTMYERQLNGILADEMGLGKTIQTIALLAHLASDKENWGPHLIIVPTSVMLNWEMEFKKWCPAFKILTYYGNPKERKLKRAGWTKPNTFHVCITSYKLVLQDHHCFRRKKWKYLILDEAQNIKNFKSQRWQRLLNFDSERRLLLTGTPLQNNLMELWSLMHFLMPNLFSSHREFKEWFSNPVTGMIEGNAEYNENIIKRLHKVLRPFLLRRLKIEVEKQLPSKYEHIVMCRLSNRQRFLYDDFMSRAKTKETLSAGNLLSVINVLMQLRKVCNHPNLFEQRPIISPFQMENINYHTASIVDSALDYDPFRHVNLNALNLQLVSLENELTAWSVYRLKRLKVPRKLIEEMSESPSEAPPVPKGKLNIRLKTPGDLKCIQVDSNVRNNQKLVTFLKNTSIPTWSSSNNVCTSTPIGTPVKVAPIFRTIIGQGEMSSMAVKRNKFIENATTNRGSYAVQMKSTKGSAVPSKLCFMPGTKQIHAVLRPVSIKNTATGAETATSLTGGPSTVNSSSISTVAASSSIVSTLATMSGIVPTSSVIAVSSGSSTQILTNSLSQLMTSTGKQFIFTPASGGAGIRSQPPNVKSGQRVILTKSVTGNTNSIVAPLIRYANSSAQQGSVLNNGANSNISTTIPSTIILNNSLKPSISIPKPISTSTVTSSHGSANTISSVSSSAVTRSKADKPKTEILPEAAEVKERRKRSRKEKLRMLADVNERKSSSYVMFGCDVRTTLKILDANSCWQPVENDEHYWKCAGHVNCINVQYAKHVHNLCNTLTNALANSVKSIEERIQELSDTFSRYIVYVPAVNARRPTMQVSHPAPSKAWSLSYMECMLEKDLAPRSKSLHQIVSRMSTAFPDSRLIQYDCGKLQTLDTLLRRLKLEQHRVLIFTQMARMLDVLEAFLTFHGHIYLRLDGSTRIDQRQVLMERFNADKRYFCFILSTRSGGIGVNLTGADTVIFYDSDWNPTMDAQAQDRCHRIGQTRDVHIYRLISEKTVEENILKKANQKKLLGDLAIEGGNFTAAYFKSTTIHDLFNVDFDEADPAKRMSDVASDSGNAQAVEKSTLNAYESALAAAEDEPDVAAAQTAKDEAVAELAEFDENIPLVDNDTNPDVSMQPEEVSKAEQEVAALIEQLTPIERWALQFMETVDTEWAEEQLAAAEAEIEQQKKEWEMERLAIEQADARSKRLDEEADDDDVPLTYSSEDAKNQTWLSLDSADYMPIWLPLPTLFSIEDNENYIDRSMKYLYDTVAIPEQLLPPVYLRKEKKKQRLDQPSSNQLVDSTTHIRVRNRHRDGLSSATLSVASLEPPRSLFDRPSSIVAKLRHDMRLQKYRGLPRSTIPNVPGLKPYFPPKLSADPEFVPDWLIHEDYALLQAIQHVQELPLNLSVMYPGHVANWDLVSELVNQVSRIYRSPQQCKNRFESAILPREEGKLTSDPITKKHKKLKGLNQMVSHSKYTRNCKTAQLYLQDSNNTFTQMMNSRFDAIRGVSNRRAPTIKRLPINTSTKNPKHAQVLVECGIDYEHPLTPVEIAAKRAQRLAKEKQSQMATAEQLLLRQGNAQQLAKQQQPATQLQQPVIVQQLQPQMTAQKTIPISTTQTAVVVNISQNSAISSASPVTIRSIGHRPINEMIVVSSNQQVQSSSVAVPQPKSTTTMSATNLISTSNIQRIIPITQITTTGTVPTSRIVTTSNKPASQVQLYKHQSAIPQHQLKIIHPRSKTPVVVPTNVVVSSPQPQRQQQSPQQPQSQQQQQQQQQSQQQQQQRQQLLKTVSGAVASTSNRISDAEFAILLKKQQLHQQQQKLTPAAVIATSNTPVVQTQFITTQAAGALSKSTVGVTLPTIKTATLTASGIKASPTAPQHIRQITIGQQVQQRKLQRVTPIGQVMVNVTQSGQGISHVLTKGAPGNVQTATHLMGARVIPVVVNASALRAATSPNVTIDSTGTRHIQQALPSNTIKISGSPSTLAVATVAQQQQFLNQLVQNQSLVRQGNLKIQNTGIVSGTATSASGTVTLSSPNQIINMPAAQSQTPTSEKKGM